MAKYSIKHTCGHNEVHQIFGTNAHGERDRKCEWLESRLCEACWKAEKEAQNQASAKENNLPALSGSEKQVSWAGNIRAEKMAEIKEAVAYIDQVVAALEAKGINECLNLRDDVYLDNGDYGDRKVRDDAFRTLTETYTGSYADLGSPMWAEQGLTPVLLQRLREDPSKYVHALAALTGRAIAETESDSAALRAYLDQTADIARQATPEGRRAAFRVVEDDDSLPPGRA